MSRSRMRQDLYHEGELAVQQRAGAESQALGNGSVIGNEIIPGAIRFVKKQPLIVVSSIDQQENIWVSMVIGQSGFITAEPDALNISVSKIFRVDADPLWQNLNDTSHIGILIIDLRSRARLRVNGRVAFSTDQPLRVEVEQAYPNCPQYIQRRNFRGVSDSEPESTSASGCRLTVAQQRWAAEADTLFVGSAHSTKGVDASHRGGNPGFVQVLNSTRLRIPDYAGNGMFNTLGNFFVNPRAGIVIPDFQNGHVLQLTGRVEVQWDVDDPNNETAGTGRYWDFVIDRWIQSDHAIPGATEFLDYSPHNPVTAK